METKYTKLSALVNNTFTVQKVWGYSFKMWDQASGHMVKRDTWAEGFRKVYDVDTDKGKLDLSASQLGNLLETVFNNGAAELTGKTFSVKSNGKTGMDIRYFFNQATPTAPTPQLVQTDSNEEDVKPTETPEKLEDPTDDIDLSDIPF